MHDCGMSNCGIATSLLRISDAGFDFEYCRQCGSLRIPDANLVYTSVEPDAPGKTPVIMNILLSMRAVWFHLFLPQFRNKSARILDVGCGDGQFLEYLGDRGYHNAIGFEVEPARLRHAQSRGITVLSSLEDVVKQRGGQFDLVFLWHVLEHLDEPVAMLNQLVPLIAAGGVLVVAVPNQVSLQTRLFRRRSSFVDYGRHVWYWGPSYFEWLDGVLPGVTVRRLRELNYEYEIYGWVDTLVSAVVGETNFVHGALKKGHGGVMRKLTAVSLSAVALLPAILLSHVAVVFPRLSGTLTYTFEPAEGKRSRCGC